MQFQNARKESEILELIEGTERDRRRLSELLDGIRVGAEVDAMADGMREQVWADVRDAYPPAGDCACGLRVTLRLRSWRHALSAAAGCWVDFTPRTVWLLPRSP